MEKMDKVLRRAIGKWGIKAQLEMLQEESTELSLAARKFIRKQNDNTFSDLGEEIADTLILIRQVELMFPRIKHIIESTKRVKIDRLEERINDNRFE